MQTNVISAFSPREGTTSPNRSVGAILIDSGRLREEDAASVLRYQRQHQMRFGDAAVALGLIKPEDLAFALSSQFSFPYLRHGESAVSEEVIAAYNPFSDKVEALRALRSSLMLRWFDQDDRRKALAVVSPDRGEGRSFLTANLAVVFSQLGERVLVIDADMRNPRQHALFGLTNNLGLSSILSGRAGLEVIRHNQALSNLSFLTSGPTPPNPQELLGRTTFSQLLFDLAPEFDVILVDSPAGIQSADAQTIATRAGAALLVARKNVSQIRGLKALATAIGQASTVVGTVLNEF